MKQRLMPISHDSTWFLVVVKNKPFIKHIKLSFSINFEVTLPCKSRVEILKLSIDEWSVKPGKDWLNKSNFEIKHTWSYVRGVNCIRSNIFQSQL